MSKLFPPEVHDFFKEHNYGRSAQEMADLLNTTFGTSYTREQIKAYRARQHWDSGLTGCFEKGHTPFNKGRKGISYPGMQATQFKAGHIPKNHRPVGSTRIDRDGYVYKKVEEPNKWRMLHVLNWEAAHGPVPPGHVLLFKDQDKTHCDVDNLLLVTRGELAVMNKHSLCTENPDATQAGHTLARLIKATTARKKQRGKKEVTR